VPALFMLLLLAAPALAAWILEGRILDGESGRPLPAAHLRLLDSPLGTAADLDGRFRLELGERQRGRLLVSHLGYRSAELEIRREDGAHLDLALRPSWVQAGDLVYSADLREQTVRSASTKVDIVPRETLDRAPSQDLSRALEILPGISIKRSDGVTVNSLSIRGSSNLLGGGAGNRVLLLVDGHPMISADTGGADWSLVPLAIVERVEVAKGSYSALYGSTAMGGVINLVTQRRFPRHRTLVRAGYGLGEAPPAEQRFRDTPTTESHLAVTHSNQLPALGYYLSYTQRESNGHRQNSDYLLHTLSSRFRFGEPQAARRWELSLGAARLNRGFPHSWESRRRPLHLSRHHPEWIDDRQRKAQFSADLAWEAVGPRLALRATAWNHFGLSETRYFDAELTDTRSRADKHGLRLVGDWSGLPGAELIAGVEAQFDRVDGRPDEIFYGRHRTSTWAAFAQQQWTPAWLPDGAWLGDPTLSAGLRADRREVHGHSVETLLSPKLGLSLPGGGPLEAFTGRASWGRAFRSPAIADLFLKSVPGNDYRFEANPALKAERSDSWEAGLLWTPLRSLALDATRFVYAYREMIHYRDTEDVSVFEIVNLQQAFIRGWELSAELRHGDWSGTLGWTWVNARNLENDRPLPYQPRRTLAGSAAWSPGRWRLAASLRQVGATEEVRFYPSDAPRAYRLLGLKAAYDLGAVEVAASVDNLRNTQYEEMERYRMPGRTWRLDLLFTIEGRGRQESQAASRRPGG
jgi:outer membrane cobalamin receptor